MGRHGPSSAGIGTNGAAGGRDIHGESDQALPPFGLLIRGSMPASPGPPPFPAASIEDGLIAYIQSLLRDGPPDLARHRGFGKRSLQGAAMASTLPIAAMRPGLGASGAVGSPRSMRRVRETRRSAHLPWWVPAYRPRRKPPGLGATTHHEYIGRVRRP